MNQEIRAREVRLVDDEGRQLGVLVTREALRLAVERGLDLVEVAPTASPVVCRIMDYGRFKYEQDKREREARRKQHVTEVKELVIKTMNIDDHDLGILARKAERFLRDGDKVKVTLRFKGREIVHADIGRLVLRRFVKMIESFGQVEMEGRLEGRNLNIVLAPRPEVLVALRQRIAAQQVVRGSTGAKPGAEADVEAEAEAQPTESVAEASPEAPSATAGS